MHADRVHRYGLVKNPTNTRVWHGSGCPDVNNFFKKPLDFWAFLCYIITMKDDYRDIYFFLIIGIASFFVILATGIYIETL